MGSEFVLCDGASVCGSGHGFCGSVQGPGDLGCSDRVLDLSDHVAILLEGFLDLKNFVIKYF